MVFAWLKARDAVDAGSELADSFPAQTTAAYIREYIDRCSNQLRTRKLSFYKRVRFANAFKWRLLEKGVAAETAHDITQTLLINMGSPGSATTPVAAPAPTRAPVSHESLDALFKQAAEATARGDYSQAVDLYKQYTVGRPKHAPGFNNLGATLSRLGRYEEARKHLHTALRLDPKNVEAMFNKGNLSMAGGALGRALRGSGTVVPPSPAD